MSATTPSRPHPADGSWFPRILAASTTSSLGTGIRLVAFPLLAVSQTSDPRVVAGLALAGSLPSIVLALPVGTWVDRAHRGRLMVLSDTACFIVMAALAVCVYLGIGGIPLLFAAAAVLGAAELIFGTSLYALLPSVVAGRDLVRANSHLAVGQEIAAGGIGPAVSGVLFSLSQVIPFAINAVTYLASSLLVGSFAFRADTRAKEHRPEPDPPTIKRSTAERLRDYGTELFGGITLAARNKPLLATLLLDLGAGIFGWMPEGTLVLFATEELAATDTQFGLLMAVTAIGAVIGGLAAPRLVDRLGLVRVIVITYLTYGLLMIPIGLAPSIWVVMILFVLQGLPLIACSAALQSAQQLLIPDHILGRFAALRRLVSSVSGPVGLALGGFLSAWLNLRTTWLIAAVGFIAVFLLCLRGIREMGDAVHKAEQEAPRTD